MSATQTQPQPNTLSQAASQFVDYRVQPDPVRTSRMTTEELRGAYLIDRLFEPGRVCLYYLDFDRAVVGGAVPTSSPLRLEADYQHMAVTTFLERRELGVMNIGAPGTVTVDGTVYPMSADEVLYVGRGATDVFFSSDNAAAPARFYLVSYPAHAIYPTTHATLADANLIRLGSKESCNERLLYQFIHPDGIKSCQLDFGFTRLQPGSVWNTMPCHTHTRRSEIYMYYGIGAGDGQSFVVHLMGEPTQSRSLIVRDGQAAISPAWSIHSGCGTANYTFVWAMGGENQVFANMDPVAMNALI